VKRFSSRLRDEEKAGRKRIEESGVEPNTHPVLSWPLHSQPTPSRPFQPQSDPLRQNLRTGYPGCLLDSRFSVHEILALGLWDSRRSSKAVKPLADPVVAARRYPVPQGRFLDKSKTRCTAHTTLQVNQFQAENGKTHSGLGFIQLSLNRLLDYSVKAWVSIPVFLPLYEFQSSQNASLSTLSIAQSTSIIALVFCCPHVLETFGHMLNVFLNYFRCVFHALSIFWSFQNHQCQMKFTLSL